MLENYADFRIDLHAAWLHCLTELGKSETSSALSESLNRTPHTGWLGHSSDWRGFATWTTVETVFSKKQLHSEEPNWTEEI